jgi:hypothetical protein
MSGLVLLTLPALESHERAAPLNGSLPPLYPVQPSRSRLSFRQSLGGFCMPRRQNSRSPKVPKQQIVAMWPAIITAVVTILRLAWDVWRSR